MKRLKVAIIGSGSRGLDTYAPLFAEKSKQYEVVAFCDIRKVRLDLAQKIYKTKKDMLFLNEKDFFKKRLGDICVVATQDQDHVRHAIKAMELGYNVLLEKPITPSLEECHKLLAAQKKYNKKVVVCHVLRYAPAYLVVDRLLKTQAVGRLLDINALEQVAYWHQAHSFVRGNWRKKEETSPMILAKCCHDLDLLQHFADSRCKCLSSMGSLDLFKKSNKPKGAAKRCKDCKLIKNCPYSAEDIYIRRWKDAGKPKDEWPYNVVCTDLPLTEAKIRKAYESNGYGRCVYECDNNVVDHQQTIVTFENGVTANLCMTAFTGKPGRVYQFHCTEGEIDLNEETREILIKPFGKKVTKISIDRLNAKDKVGHGGGDEGLVDSLYDVFTGKGSAKTNLAASIESHLMAFAAEESRLNNGKLICIKHK